VVAKIRVARRGTVPTDRIHLFLKLPAGKVLKLYNGRGNVENRIKEDKNTLRSDKASCRCLATNQARLLTGGFAYNL
jgi:hypothetical protein